MSFQSPEKFDNELDPRILSQKLQAQYQTQIQIQHQIQKNSAKPRKSRTSACGWPGHKVFKFIATHELCQEAIKKWGLAQPVLYSLTMEHGVQVMLDTLLWTKHYPNVDCKAAYAVTVLQNGGPKPDY